MASYSIAALLFLTTCLFGFSAEKTSPDWFYRAWQTEDGLPDNSVSGIAQSPDGYIYVGTNGGVIRFNGTQFSPLPLRVIPKIPSLQVRSMFLDRQGSLWLGMERGPVIRVGEKSFRAFSRSDGIPDSQVMSFTDDHEGRIWIAYLNKICLIENETLTLFGTKENIPFGRKANLACDTDGRIWLANGGKLGNLDKEGFHLIRDFNHTKLALVPSLTQGVLLSVGSTLMQVDSDNQFTTIADLPSSTTVNSLFEDRSGAVWAGTQRSGLFRLQDGILARVATSHNAIECITEDLENNIWVGTIGGGLNLIRPRSVDFIEKENGLPFSSVRSTSYDASGQAWAVSHDGQLAYQKDNVWHLYQKVTLANCVAADAEGRVWIGTSTNGLFLLQNDKLSHYHLEEGLASRHVRSLFCAQNGDLWIATSLPDKLHRLRDGKITQITHSIPFSAIRALTETTDGTIWAGSSDGLLFRVEGNHLVDESSLDGPLDLSIRALHATSDGSLWIGYAGNGLGHYKNAQYRRITTEEGLHDDYISQIQDDGAGSLWIAANRGLFQVGISDLLTFPSKSTSLSKVRCRPYGPYDGVPSIQPSRDYMPTVSRSPDNKLYFPTHSGILEVSLDRIRKNTQPPPVVLEKVSLDNKVVAFYKKHSLIHSGESSGEEDLSLADPHLDIPPDHDKLVVSFAALSLASPENVQLRYRLHPMDSNWEEIDHQKSVTFSRLPAGNYTFQVIASNNAGVWNEAGAKLSITVHPFFWETWWFKISIGLTTAFAAGGLVYLAQRRKHRRQLRLIASKRALEQERSRIARDIHDDLGASLTRITLLSQSSPSHEKDTQQEVLDNIHSTARHLMRSMEEVVWAVNPEHDTFDALANYLSNYGQGFLSIAGVSCRLEMPLALPERTLSAQLRHNLFLAYKEALNNAVKYAEASEVRISLKLGTDSFTLKVTDNGVGIDPNAPDNPLRPSSGSGLANMKNRMDEIGGTCDVHSTPGEGTTVEFKVPFKITLPENSLRHENT